MNITSAFQVGQIYTSALANELPFGFVAYAQRTATQGGIVTATDLTDLTVTFTALANRRYKITSSGMLRSSVSGDTFNWVIVRGSTRLSFRSFYTAPVNVAVFSGHTIIDTPSAGSVTYKIQAERNTGTGTGTLQAVADYPAFILVEDIGAA
jgi:hypothetical protein